MKKLKLTTVILLIAAMAYGQGVAINEDGAAPDPSAMLEVTSNEKGILIPRMTQAQRDAIAEPATGLLIFQTNATPGFYFNAGSAVAPDWQRLGEGSAGQWSQSGDNIYYLHGNVGIGEPSPQGQFHVSVPGEWAGIDFSGTGLNDLEVDISGYNGIGATHYAVRIDNPGPTPNLIQTSNDGGDTWSPTFPIAPDIEMGFGVVINFGSTGGHTWNDRWDWTVNESIADILVVKDGNVGIGTAAPTALLHTLGTETGEGNVLFEGAYKSSPGNPPTTGAGTRLMWYPDKAAFRAGYVTDGHWDKDNIGDFSIAMGENTVAKGFASAAIGRFTTASSIGAIAMGSASEASGGYSTAIGNSVKATSYSSTAIGNYTNALGFSSTALGTNTTAKSAYETVVGRWNTDYTPESTNEWNAADRLFVIGNGTGIGSPSNAITVLKNGNTGIGTSNPVAQLHTTGSVRLAGAGEPGAGKVLTSDEAGNATWEPPFAMPTGSNMQTLRHDGSAWVANSILRNNGTGLGVGANPIANTQLYLSRPYGIIGPGYANIYARRAGASGAANGGTSWSWFGVDAAIKGYSDWGNNFSAAVAGYGYLDYANSAAVIGSNPGGTTYGALAFKDANNTLWAGYFNGNVRINGTMRIQGGSPGEGKILTSDENGNATWQDAIVTYQIGDFAHGGVVFYVEACGTKGLVCAIEDQDGGSGIKWRGGGTNYNTMARGDEIYAGKMNTSIIIAVHSAKDDFDNHAALVCANYTGGGFGDWYLPSKEELNQMYINRTAINNTATANGGTGFTGYAYWSSSEISNSLAWLQYIESGVQYWVDKDFSYRVRAVRAF